MTLGKTDLQCIALKEAVGPSLQKVSNIGRKWIRERGMLDGLKSTGAMMRKTNQLNVVVSGLAAENRLKDTAGSPSESYDWRHMANVLREWRHEFWRPFIKRLDLTRAERVSIEARVRKELYP
jgi:hypothetical protein